MRVITPSEFQPTVRYANFILARPDATWPDRTIADYELILVVKGRFVYETAGMETIVVDPGRVLMIPPEERHTFRRVDRGKKAILACIHGELCTEGTRGSGDYAPDPEPDRLTVVDDDPAIEAGFERCAIVFDGHEKYRTILLQTIAKEIWLRLAARWSGSDSRAKSVRMEQMIAYIREHLLERISRRDLAHAFHLTPEHVNAVFKRELGVSPTQFIHRERIMRAYRLMNEEGLSAKEVSAMVGYSDPFYFSRVFKRVMSMSPCQALGKRQWKRRRGVTTSGR